MQVCSYVRCLILLESHQTCDILDSSLLTGYPAENVLYGIAGLKIWQKLKNCRNSKETPFPLPLVSPKTLEQLGLQL